MYKIFYNILYASIITSILGIVILLFRKTFDKKISPTYKFVMWGLMFFTLIFPFRITLQSNNSHKFLISSLIDKIENIKESLILNEVGKTIIYIWFAVMCIIFIYYIITSIIFKKMIGNKEVKDKKILEILEFSKKQMGIKKEIKLIKQEYKKIPCIYGLFKTKILVTDEILKKDEESLKYIFMHELAHFKRKDLILNKILIAITTVHWFNIGLWYCFKQIRQDMELKADEMVLEKIGKQEEKSYAKTLVKLIPISNNEKQPVKLLCITDEKKNMERRIDMIKLSDKFKEYKSLIGITTLLIVLCIGTFIFTRIEPKEETGVVNSFQYFETPDRIVYKEKNTDNYYVFKKGESSYTDILNEIIKVFDSKEEGIQVSKEDIEAIEKNQNYIELDYDTISKNYVIAYEEDLNNIILRNDNGGQVVKQSIKEEYKKELQEKLDEKILMDASCYHMGDNKQYILNNKEIEDDVIVKNVSGLTLYESGIYGIKIQNKQKLDEILNRYNVTLEEQINDDIFEKSDVIVMISKYDIEKIETRIGGLTYFFTGSKLNNSYIVNVFQASKAINTNCIYRNLDNTISNSTSNSYYVVNDNISNSENENSSNIKTEVKITKEEAAKISEKEAKKEKYQYQGWESDFSATEVWVDENGNYEISGELLYSLDDIHKAYYWEENWAVKDSNGNNLYKGQPVWCIRLGDKNDPLTNLYIYVDANNGDVVGAGQASD